MGDRLLILDLKGIDYPTIGKRVTLESLVKNVRPLMDTRNKFEYRVTPGDDRDRDIGRFFRLAAIVGNVTVIAEEASAYRTNGSFQWVLVAGRARNIRVVVVAQRAHLLTPTVREQTDACICFWTDSPEDRKYLAAKYGDGHVAELDHIDREKWEFCAWGREAIFNSYFAMKPLDDKKGNRAA